MEHLSGRSHLSRNLRALREQARLTQKTFLARLSQDLSAPMDQGALSKKETGDRAISVDELLLFAAALDVSPTQLLIPRPGSGDLKVSGKLSIPPAQAREWITGRRPLGLFDGVPSTALTLPEDALHDQLGALRTQIACLKREIEVREGLIDNANSEIEERNRAPTLFDTGESNLTVAPFQNWVEKLNSAIQDCQRELTRLRGEEAELERHIEAHLAQPDEPPTQPQADASEEA